MAYGNNLYPPIVPSSMPAFIKNSVEGCKLYFSFSSYNSYDDVAFIQISIKHYKTNYSVFNNATGIIAVRKEDIQVDPNVKTNFKYYIKITDDMVGFKIGELYKVQLRLVGGKGIRNQFLPANRTAEDYSTDLSKVYEDIDFYSEWSTVCVIKPISDITVQFCNLEEDGIPQINQKVDLNGKIIFADPDDTESLSRYRIRIFYYTDSKKENPLSDSGDLVPKSGENDISYISPIEFTEGESYTIELTYTTLNGYSEVKNYSFFKVSSYNDKLDIVLKADLDNDNGRIKVLFYQEDYEEYKDWGFKGYTTPGAVLGVNETPASSTTPDDTNQKGFSGKLVVRRCDSTTNFRFWETIAEFNIKTTHGIKDYFYDLTVESGVWYKYSISRVSFSGEYGRAVIMDKPLMPVFDSAFLVSNNKILKLEYSTTVSGFKRNVLESKTETIGSQYPFTKRNSIVDYKSFSISSIVSALTDKENIFTSKEEIYKDSKDLYQEYNNVYNISNQYDYIYEREFRNKVMDFLYKNSIKLFKSPTEGNVLVKLMNINFAPNEQVGRLIYTLNAEAIEQDECSVYNYKFYNIQSPDLQIEEKPEAYLKLGQVVVNNPEMFTNGNVNVYDIISDNFGDLMGNGNKTKVENIQDVKLTFDSQPSLIKIENGQYSIAGEAAAVSRAITSPTYVEGYLINIDGEYIIVNPNLGYYEVPNDIEVNKIHIYDENTTVFIDFVASIVEELDFEQFSYERYIKEIVGQVYGYFKEGESLYDILSTKYYETYDTDESSEKYTINLVSINGIAIEAAPGTEILIKDAYDEIMESHIINDTGYLRISADDLVLSEIIFNNDAVAMIDYYCETEKEVRQKNV